MQHTTLLITTSRSVRYVSLSCNSLNDTETKDAVVLSRGMVINIASSLFLNSSLCAYARFHRFVSMPDLSCAMTPLCNTSPRVGTLSLKCSWEWINIMKMTFSSLLVSWKPLNHSSNNHFFLLKLLFAQQWCNLTRMRRESNFTTEIILYLLCFAVHVSNI